MEPPGVTRSLVAIGLVAASCLVAGCQAPSASTAPNPIPTSVAASISPAPTAGATQSPATGVGGLFHVVGSAPVLAQSMFADRNAILPGAVTPAADGTYHAWVVAFAKAPGVQDIHHLTSADAISWTDRADPSLAALSTGLGRPGALPTSVLETSSGWVMYFVGTLASEDRGWDVWRATAPGPGGPWTRSDGPVFRRGAAGSWDAGALDFPTVIATDTGYSMFYSAIPTLESATGSVGLATSTDGIAWTRHDDPATTAASFAKSDPVATAGLCGGFDDRAVEQPRVISGPNGLYLVYAGYAGDLSSRASVGFASSLDGGLTWACQWPASVLDVTELPAGDGVHTVNAFMRGERVALLIEWLRNGGSEDWLVHLGPRQP